MDKYTKSLLLLFVLIVMHGTVKADIVSVTLGSTADGFIFIESEENVDTTNFDNPQIAENFGNLTLGSAGSFDSVSDIDGDEILFKNGNAAFGSQSISSSRTVVNIEFRNSGTETVLPTLQSQILPAGMGFFITDCTAENLRDCESIGDDIDYGLTDIDNPNGDTELMSAEFNFSVLLEGIAEPLFSLSGGLSLTQNDLGEKSIVTDLSAAENTLNNFRQTSPDGNQQQITYDWGATDFSVAFPEGEELIPGEVATLSYIIEVSTSTNSSCSAEGCPIAYAAFGDPIGRGGRAGTINPNQRSARAASYATASNTQIDGYEAGLYRMALPTFEDGILTYRANSGPGIAAAAVPTPAPFALLVIGLTYLTLSRKRNLK